MWYKRDWMGVNSNGEEAVNSRGSSDEVNSRGRETVNNTDMEKYFTGEEVLYSKDGGVGYTVWGMQ